MSYVYKETEEASQVVFDEESSQKYDRLLLIGVFLLLTGLFVSAAAIDAAIKVITDGRLLNWRYLIACVPLAAFAVKLVVDAVNARRFDLTEDEWERNRRFKTMAFVLSIEIVIAVFLHACGQFHALAIPFLVWFKLGLFSLRAFLEMAGLIALAGLTFYYVRQWIVTFSRI